MAIRFPLRLMWSPCGSGLSGRLGEEGPHERLKLLPLALGTLVLAPLPLADAERLADVRPGTDAATPPQRPQYTPRDPPLVQAPSQGCQRDHGGSRMTAAWWP